MKYTCIWAQHRLGIQGSIWRENKQKWWCTIGDSDVQRVGARAFYVKIKEDHIWVTWSEAIYESWPSFRSKQSTIPLLKCGSHNSQQDIPNFNTPALSIFFKWFYKSLETRNMCPLCMNWIMTNKPIIEANVLCETCIQNNKDNN